jgi:hypothetical protein
VPEAVGAILLFQAAGVCCLPARCAFGILTIAIRIRRVGEGRAQSLDGPEHRPEAPSRRVRVSSLLVRCLAM